MAAGASARQLVRLSPQKMGLVDIQQRYAPQQIGFIPGLQSLLHSGIDQPFFLPTPKKLHVLSR